MQTKLWAGLVVWSGGYIELTLGCELVMVIHADAVPFVSANGQRKDRSLRTSVGREVSIEDHRKRAVVKLKGPILEHEMQQRIAQRFQ